MDERDGHSVLYRVRGVRVGGWGVFYLCGGRRGGGMVSFAHDAQCVMCVIFDVI